MSFVHTSANCNTYPWENRFSRAKTVTLKETKLPFYAICRQLQLKNPSKVQNIHNNFQRTGSLNFKKQNGRPKKLSEADERFLYRKLAKNRFTMPEKIRTDFNSFSFNKTLSTNTIRQLLKRKNFTRKPASEKLLLKARTSKQRRV